MDPFWHYARRMLKHRRTLALALVFAFLSAVSFGAGLGALGPIIENILTVPKGVDADAARAAIGRADDVSEDDVGKSQVDRALAIDRELHRRVDADAVRAAIASATGAPPDKVDPAQVERAMAIDKELHDSDKPPSNLRALAKKANQKLHAVIPGDWIEALPTGRFAAVLWIVISLGVLTMFGAVCNFLHSYLSLTVVARTIAGIRRDAFHRAVHLPLRTMLAIGPSDAISRIVYDTATLGSGLNAMVSKAVAQVSKGIVAVVVAFYYHWLISVIAICVAPILATIIKRLGKKIRRASRTALEGQAGLYKRSTEALMGARVVKSFTAERIESARFHKINKGVVLQEFRVRTARAASSPLVETISIVVLGALALFAAKAIIDEALSPTNFIGALGSLGLAAAQIKPLTGFVNDVQQSAAAADRIRQLMELEPEPGHGIGLARLAPHKRSIAFEDVTFTYPGAAGPALKEVSLTIPHGRTLAFVGLNGSGKTTLLSLVPRLFDPDSGRVLVDGRDIREVNVRSLRRQIGVVTQDTVLFTGPIVENIAYGSGLDPVKDLEVIRDAARRARAEEFILEKPGGYGFALGEGGSGLSGGQRQRLAIARAILRDPAILILDEATSMIDADSERKIAEAIAEFVGSSAARRTCLVVAHRLSTVKNADEIVVMDAGRIEDRGRHEELLLRSPVYQQIARAQLGA
jgi:subfamily B ATP-binding cassette protein MsbA